MAVACAERLTFNERVDQAMNLLMSPSLILIWSFSDPIHPQVSNNPGGFISIQNISKNKVKTLSNIKNIIGILLNFAALLEIAKSPLK